MVPPVHISAVVSEGVAANVSVGYVRRIGRGLDVVSFTGEDAAIVAGGGLSGFGAMDWC